jgi:hypothetical protein
MNCETKVIKSNFDYLRKFFVMPNSPDKFIEFGHELRESWKEAISGEKGDELHTFIPKYRQIK